jgi:hypothetical protein
MPSAPWSWRSVGIARATVAVGLVLTLALAACSASSSGGGGIQIPPLDAGLTSSSAPPTIQGNDPGGQYAFVYANQIWIKLNADAAPRQLTHLALVSSSYFAWGPLVWSPSGSYIAFVLIQDIAGDGPPRNAGPLYIVNTTTDDVHTAGDVQVTAGTAGIYGHAYAWYGDHALFYSNGAGITAYDYSDPSDPRAFEAITVDNGPNYTNGTPGFTTYGDLQFVGQDLYATRIDVSSFGTPGQVGEAHIVHYSVYPSARAYRGGGLDVGALGQVTNLGLAYSDDQGEVRAGSWAIASDGGMVYQQVQSADAKANTVKAKTCYVDTVASWCGQELFQQAGTQPTSSVPQLAFSHGGSLIALSGQALYTEANDGSQFSSTPPGVWGTPPQWSPSASFVIGTQLVSSATDARGVVHYNTNLVMFTLGAKPAVLITGALDFSWAPNQ